MHPTIRTLWRNRFTAILSIFQMTLALAVVMNAFSIFDARIERAFRPTGIDESDLIAVKQSWVTNTDANGRLDTSSFVPRQTSDAAALLAIPGVTDVSVTNSLPLAGWSRTAKLSRRPSDKTAKTDVALYFGDASFQKTLRFRISEGRDFTPTEVRNVEQGAPTGAGPVLITRALAETLFPGGPALGQTFYINGSGDPNTVVGIIDRLQTPSRAAWGDTFAYSSVVLPLRVATDSTYFAVRTSAGASARVASFIQGALISASPNRVIEADGIQSFHDMRVAAYRSDLAMAWMMLIICGIFLLVTGSGVVGLTSFWVRKRQRSIGVRRALGATRRDILLQFLAENAVMAVTAAVLGALSAIVINRILMSHFEARSLEFAPILGGMIALVVLSALASLIPALRAAAVAPVVAIRSS